MKQTPYTLPVALIAACLVASLMTLSSCGRPDRGRKEARRKSPPIMRSRFVKPQPVSEGFVGSAACQRCHAEIMEEYASHPMSRSMARTPTTQIADYEQATTFSATENLKYSVEKTTDEVLHRELVLDAGGKEVARYEEDIEFTCGSGTRGCSYFSFKQGRLFQSPVTWYAKKQKWDLSPGYFPPQHPRFDRMASDGCMACHAGRMDPVPGERSRFNEPEPFHELSIGCERCHGPGQDHIEFHDASQTDGKQDPIVNPAKLSSELRDAVCYQCHLQGENRIPRYGRSEYDFRPGMHLSDVWIPFLKSGKATDGSADAVSQVEQMQQSACYVNSGGELGCVSCHDPHRSPAPDQQIQFYRDSCLQCHAESLSHSASNSANTADNSVAYDESTIECGLNRDDRIAKSPQDSCIQCHMPRLNAGDVPHTAQTDHRVQIPEDGFEYPPGKRELRLWLDGKVPSNEIARAKAIFLAERAFLSDNARLAEKAMEGLSEFYPPPEDDLALNEALAQLYSVKGDRDSAMKIWTRLLEQWPKDEFLLTQISLSLHESGKVSEALPYYKRLVAVNNFRTQTLRRYLDACTKLGEINRGIGVAKRIIELDPGSAITHQWLAKAFETRDPEQAEYHSQMAEKLK